MNLCLASLAGEGRLSLTAAAATRGRGRLMLGTTLVSTNTSFTPLTAVPHRGVEIRAGRGGGPRLTPRDSSTPGTGGRGGRGPGHIPQWKFLPPPPPDIFSRGYTPRWTLSLVGVYPCGCSVWTATCCDNGTLTTFVADSLAQSYHMYNLGHIIWS